MKIFRLICFFVLPINGIVCAYLWSFVLIASIARYLVGILLCCNLLVLIDAKSKMFRDIIDLLMAIIMILGLVYTVFCRRPLGFILAFSSGVVIIKNIFAQVKLVHATRDNTVSKLINGCLIITITTLLVCFCCQFVKLNDTRLINGNEVFWDKDSNKFFAEICADAKTDEEKIMAAYNWIIQNMEYDDTYETAYQYFDVRKTLDTKTGVCYEYANLFSAICRSQGISCCCVDGMRKNNTTMLHTWNKVYFNGLWWSLDVTFDSLSKSRKFGFQKCEDLYSPDEEYIITKIY